MLNVKKTLTKVLGSTAKVAEWIEGDSAPISLDTNCSYYKRNGTVLLTGYSNGMALTTSYKVLGTLPVGYRPPTMLYFSASTTAGSNHVFGYVDTDGKVGIRSASNATLFWVFTMSFPVGGVIRQLLSTLATAFVRKGVAVC